ncbi:hypothetical protein IFT75_14275 [Pseudomonas sp. CFBP 8758]|uniref:hypothetical protein n=1 Tax=Pseudomonas sp. CFBP 8758 TaxID=2775286 RepID=UPI001786BF29|nr:hypothetical protein [Pseudomonas sp. CFBP 8758]MBD8594581.1 hypothetical protein [Pseudomonas sp. CFBP 8758]
MKSQKYITTALLAGLLAAAAVPAMADNSTGPTNPAAKGTVPSAVGVPAGTDSGMTNRNTDGTAAPRNGTSTDIKPQNTGNPEGSSMGSAVTKPGSGTMDGGDGTGSEGGKR